MGIMHHIKKILDGPPQKSPQEKITSQVRGLIGGHQHKVLEFHPQNHMVHVLTKKKPFMASMLAGKRKHSDGLWKSETFHWNDNHKITHKQNWTDQDHWHSGEPPIRRLHHVFQPNDRLDHIEEGVDELSTAGYKQVKDGVYKHPAGHVITVQKKEYGDHYQSYRNGKRSQVAAFSTAKSAINHLKENVVPLRPDKAQFAVGDLVTHPDHEGLHKIYSLPTASDGRDPKSIAVIRPKGHVDISKFKKVYIRHLTKV